MRNTGWISSLMDVDRVPLEFTGDDVDKFTSVIDLKGNYEFVTVICPIMDSSKVSVYIMRTSLVSEVPTLMHILDANASGSLIQSSADVSTVAIAVTFRIGGASFIRLKMNHNQSADITFYVKGFNRENM